MKILAIGIRQPLAAGLGITTTLVGKFLHKYCTTKLYKEARQVGTDRYDLAGNIVGMVIEEEKPKPTTPIQISEESTENTKPC